jgi:hypothetical protein
MDSQVLVLHVKFGRVKPHLTIAIDVNNTLKRNDNTTTCASLYYLKHESKL